MSIRFKDSIEIDGTVTVGGQGLGANAFNSTTIPTNNNQITNGAGYITLAQVPGESDTLATVTGRGATTSSALTLNGNVTLGSQADLIFKDLSGTFPTTGKGFDWTLNNDGARIYAMQPSSDSIDFVFKLRDNATLNDRFVFWVDDYTGVNGDRYPLVIRGGTQFDLVDSSLYTNGTVRLSNTGALTNVTNTNWDNAYNNQITKLAVTGNATKTLTATQQDGGTLTASWTDNSASVSNNKITLSAGSGMSGGGDFTLNQAVDKTITLTNNDKGSSQDIFKNVTDGVSTITASSNNDTLTLLGCKGTNVTVNEKERTIEFCVDRQTLSVVNEELTISDGNTVTLPTNTGPQGPKGDTGDTGAARC